jgi:hypothetical protein
VDFTAHRDVNNFDFTENSEEPVLFWLCCRQLSSGLPDFELSQIFLPESGRLVVNSVLRLHSNENKEV